ncbi:MAG: hypothetical protein FWC51_03140, partial [Proteobacteria bacterium]|nr:hypothetical protein [Pseudomonadota bacterium]
MKKFLSKEFLISAALVANSLVLFFSCRGNDPKGGDDPVVPAKNRIDVKFSSIADLKSKKAQVLNLLKNQNNEVHLIPTEPIEIRMGNRLDAYLLGEFKDQGAILGGGTPAGTTLRSSESDSTLYLVADGTLYTSSSEFDKDFGGATPGENTTGTGEWVAPASDTGFGDNAAVQKAGSNPTCPVNSEEELINVSQFSITAAKNGEHVEIKCLEVLGKDINLNTKSSKTSGGNLKGLTIRTDFGGNVLALISDEPNITVTNPVIVMDSTANVSVPLRVLTGYDVATSGAFRNEFRVTKSRTPDAKEKDELAKLYAKYPAGGTTYFQTNVAVYGNDGAELGYFDADTTYVDVEGGNAQG